MGGKDRKTGGRESGLENGSLPPKTGELTGMTCRPRAISSQPAKHNDSSGFASMSNHCQALVQSSSVGLNMVTGIHNETAISALLVWPRRL